MILLEQHSLQNEGHAEMPHLPVSTLSLCLCHGKSVIVTLLPLFSLPLLSGWWLDGFLSHFKHFFGDSVDDVRETNDYMLRCTILMQLDVERKWRERNPAGKVLSLIHI